MTPGLKKFHKIMKLAMNITADSDRAVNRLHIGLLDEDLFYLSIKKIEIVILNFQLLLYPVKEN